MEEKNPYLEQIQAWDWEKLKATALQNVGEEVWSEEPFGQAFLGSVFSLSPSGKYYTPFANGNVSEEEAKQDELFYEALGQVAEEHGMFIFNGEGDPCDIFAGISIDSEVNTLITQK